MKTLRGISKALVSLTLGIMRNLYKYIRNLLVMREVKRAAAKDPEVALSILGDLSHNGDDCETCPYLNNGCPGYDEAAEVVKSQIQGPPDPYSLLESLDDITVEDLEEMLDGLASLADVLEEMGEDPEAFVASFDEDGPEAEDDTRGLLPESMMDATVAYVPFPDAEGKLWVRDEVGNVEPYLVGGVQQVDDPPDPQININ